MFSVSSGAQPLFIYICAREASLEVQVIAPARAGSLQLFHSPKTAHNSPPPPCDWDQDIF